MRCFYCAYELAFNVRMNCAFISLFYLNRTCSICTRFPPRLQHEPSGFLLIIEQMGKTSQCHERNRTQELDPKVNVPFNSRRRVDECENPR